jgi:hypothetical protein
MPLDIPPPTSPSPVAEGSSPDGITALGIAGVSAGVLVLVAIAVVYVVSQRRRSPGGAQ